MAGTICFRLDAYVHIDGLTTSKKNLRKSGLPAEVIDRKHVESIIKAGGIAWSHVWSLV